MIAHHAKHICASTERNASSGHRLERAPQSGVRHGNGPTHRDAINFEMERAVRELALTFNATL
jgi:hypothetical protein